MSYKTFEEQKLRACKFLEHHSIPNTLKDDTGYDLVKWLAQEFNQLQHNGFHEGCFNEEKRNNYLKLCTKKPKTKTVELFERRINWAHY